MQAVVQRLRDGEADLEELAVTTRVSKHVEEYAQSTQTVAALEEARTVGRNIRPGQSVTFVVVDDSKSSRERVALVDDADHYDAEYYAGEVIRAAESVLSPVGWRETDIRSYLTKREDASLSRY